jgi:3-hydroxymyristoyl/3-hydroxydecanoyl-(acyl carrier protein) dehydratase
MLPHAYPFLLVDGQAAEAPTLRWTGGGALARGTGEAPPFLVVEMMAQAILLVLAGEGTAGEDDSPTEKARGGLLAGVEEVSLLAPLRPGDEVTAEATVLGRFGRLLKARTRLLRAGEPIAEGTLLLALEE